jgi:hypothetical protein
MLDGFMEEGKVAHLEFFYMISEKNLPSQHGIAAAAKAGHLEALKWAVNLSQGPIPARVIMEAASEGNKEILNWAYNSDPEILERCPISWCQVKNRACENGKIAGLEWLLDHGKVAEVSFGAYQLSSAVRHNNLEALKFAYSIDPKALPTIGDLNVAAGKGYLEVLVWVKSVQDRLPDDTGATDAGINGHSPVVAWLYDEAIFCEWDEYENCSKLGRLKHVCQLEDRRLIGPSPEAILRAAETGRLGFIKYIDKKMPHLLDYSTLSSAARVKGWDKVADFLTENALAPRSSKVYMSWIRQKAREEQWLSTIIALVTGASIFILFQHINAFFQ